MADFLVDNVKLAAGASYLSIDDKETPSREHSKKRELQEDVNGLFSWVEAFNSFSCILTGRYPRLRVPLVAYQTLVVREARRFHFRGWLQYDQMFRQHVAGNPEDCEWGKVNSALYAITFLSRQRGETQTCFLCMASDHQAYQCAVRKDDATRHPPRPLQQFQARLAQKRPVAGTKICYCWNDGRCARAPNCLFRHVCYRCERDHKAADCTVKLPPPLAQN